MTTDFAQSCAFGPVWIDYDASVLVPRPWTVLQSQWAAELDLPSGPLLELCAGAGHIGLAAAVLTGRDLVQVEADEVAAKWARHNAGRARWGARTEVRCGRVDEALLPRERFPLVLADPPYLPSAEVAAWPDDPVRAIDGGTDGMDVLRTCLRVATEHLDVDGGLLLQTAGHSQAEVVADDPAATGLRLVEIRGHDPARAVARFVRTA